MSVCLSVCPFARISQKSHFQIAPIFCTCHPWPWLDPPKMKCKMKCSLPNAHTQRTVTSGVKIGLNGTGFTQFNLPPTRLSTNGISHPAFSS